MIVVNLIVCRGDVEQVRGDSIAIEQGIHSLLLFHIAVDTGSREWRTRVVFKKLRRRRG